MVLSPKEKLEEELRFLKESLDIGVITEEELELGKKRIQKKMLALEKKEEISVKEIGHDELEAKNQAKETQEPIKETEEIRQEIKTTVDKIIERSKEPAKDTPEEYVPIETVAMPKDEDAIDDKKKEIRKTPKRESVKRSDSKDDAEFKDPKAKDPIADKKQPEKAELIQKKSIEIVEKKSAAVEKKSPEVTEKKQNGSARKTAEITEKKTQESASSKSPDADKRSAEKEEKAKKTIKESKEEKEYKEEKDYQKEDDGAAGWIAVLVIVALLAIIGVWFFSSMDPAQENAPAQGKVACGNNADCVKEGMYGLCDKPGTASSSCVFSDDPLTSLKVITADCSSCDTSRVIGIIQDFFPTAQIEIIEADDASGQALIEQFEIDALPAYLFDAKVLEAKRYEEFSPSFNEVKGSYVLKNNVASANLLINRSEIPKQLDIFILSGEKVSDTAQKNAQEFLRVFGNDVTYKVHRSNDPMVKELGINTFPTFLVNNRMRFGGVQSAQVIKEHYCSMNELPKCEEELRESLV